MNTEAVKFAKQYDSLFKSKTSGLKGNEIPLFRAMKDSLMGAANKFYIEEYHGTKNQVRFTGDGINARKNARCELSDLMIIVFSSKTREARLTYLQAKSERTHVIPSFNSQFMANYEQWYLLAKRPIIHGVGAFQPPQDLLNNAVYSSIGTFAFFYKTDFGRYETFYVSADNLAPIKTNKSKKGKVEIFDKSNYFSKKNSCKECISSINNYFFAYHLYNMTIGSPISYKLTSTQAIRNWICNILNSTITEQSRNDNSNELAKELIDILEPNEPMKKTSGFGSKYLLVLKSNNDL
ncbi:hypothetical protein ACEUDQ_06545 [Aeromonas caviae]|uniref:hypothetical protein n=2 Tax=Aeromonas TaxID=642 RepID=UPI0038D0CD72